MEAKPKPWISPSPNVTAVRRPGGGRQKFSTPTKTMLAAMAGSTHAGEMCTSPSAAADSVIEWATVNPVTMSSIARNDGAASSSANRKSRWSYPVQMCSTPSSPNRPATSSGCRVAATVAVNDDGSSTATGAPSDST